jgi:hypothetical protein
MPYAGVFSATTRPFEELWQESTVIDFILNRLIKTNDSLDLIMHYLFQN